MRQLGGGWWVWLLSLAPAWSAGCDGLNLGDWSRQRRAANPAAERSAAPQPAAEQASVAEDPVAQPQEPAEQGPAEVLHVNNDSITVEDVLGPLRADLLARAGTIPAGRYRDYRLEVLKARIRKLVRDSLLYQEASKGLTEQENEMIDQFTNQRIRQIVQEQYGGRQVRWQRAAAEQGLSLEEAHQRVRRDVVIYAFLERTIMPKVQEPTRRELMRYFEQRKEELIVPERREMFLIEVPKGEDPQAARETVERALAEIEAGANFQTVAGEYSRGVHAADGGAWGMITPGSIRGRWACVAEVLGELAPGQISGVIEGEEFFFIVHLGRVEPGQQPDFAAVQVRLKQAFREHQYGLLVDEQVARLHEQATIRPNDPSRFLQAVLEACPVPSPGQTQSP